jgi:Zn finger protein HypA/HybF involved in hydrogenase expression
MGRRRLTTEEFIIKAKQIHGDKYNYSLVDYIDAHTKVEIICPIHGKFEQRPKNHLYGQGCPKCGNLKQASSQLLTTEEFIEKSRKIHGDKYNYSLVDYVNNKIKVTIICPIHGEFKQRPNHHLDGRGCPECGGSKKKNTKTFIQEAKALYGDFYDYSEVDYKNNSTKVEIICNTCGHNFQIVPNNFLSGKGCPYCAYAQKCNNKPSHLYYISINNGEYYKIGVTADTLKERFKGYDLDYKVLLYEEYIRPQDARFKEQQILEKFDEFRYKEKVLKYGGDSELFTKDVLGLDKENK